MADQKTHVIVALAISVAFWAFFAPEMNIVVAGIFVLGAVLGSANGDCPGEGFNLSPDLDKFVEGKTKFLGHRSWLLHSPIMPIILIQAAQAFMGPIETQSPLIMAGLWGMVIGWLSHVVLDMETPDGWKEGKTVGLISGTASLAIMVYLLFVNPFWLQALI